MKLVLTNGCFDILHAGHVAMLWQARALGDGLIVGLNDDESVRRLKGMGRPANPLHHRAAVLRALRMVDSVVPFSGQTISGLLHKVRPAVWVKGGDYTVETLNQDEVQTARALGIEVVIIPISVHVSTTQLLCNLQESRTTT